MYTHDEDPECRVARLRNQVDIEIAMTEAQHLVCYGGYEPATGLYPGEHWRRGEGEACFHLRVHGSRAWLHWDRWDPRRYPVQHFFETPALWLPSAAVAAGALLVAGLSAGGGRR